MRKILITGLFIGMFTLAVGIGNAKALIIDSVPIWIIDGDDAGASVDITVVDNTIGFDFGYLDGGLFQLLIPNGSVVGSHTWNGGDVVDFAIRDVSSHVIYSLGEEDALGNNYCVLDFSGEIEAIYSQNPVIPFNYWSAVNMDWNILGYGGDVGFNLAIATSHPHDGVAPVPEPTSLLLLGTGLLGLAVFGRAIRKRS